MKLLIQGDTHANFDALRNAVSASVEHKCSTIIQLGDLGIWGGFEGLKMIDDLNELLRSENRSLIFVPGNHDNYDLLDSYQNLNPRSTSGHVYIRTNLLFVPRGQTWRWAGKRFLGLGGAVSIDKAWRAPRVTWWWQEEISWQEAQEAVSNVAGKEVDYFFSHDASNLTPWKTRLKPDSESMENRSKIDYVLNRVKPKMQFHGHFHENYDWQLPYSEGGSTQVYGLNMENDSGSRGVLDIKDNTFIKIN